MKKILLLTCLILITTPLMASEALDEANARFAYQGKPIHPFLVQEFSNWMSDRRPPMIATVDVAAAFDTNKYQLDIARQEADWVIAETKPEPGKGLLENYALFQYRGLGRMADGTHVLETGANGGGSGMFMDLMFIRFSEGEIMLEGKNEKQLLMSIVGIYSLGDRYGGEVEVLPDKVLIHASPAQHGGGSIEKDIELKFPLLDEDAERRLG
jgi:hypothetical protein